MLKCSVELKGSQVIFEKTVITAALRHRVGEYSLFIVTNYEFYPICTKPVTR